MRTIRISDSKNRDTVVAFGKAPQKERIQFILSDGSKPRNVKLVKLPLHCQYESLKAKFLTDEAIAEALIASDPEIDSANLAIPIGVSQRVLINSTFTPVFETIAKEVFFQPDGSIKEEKDLVERSANIQGDFPVKWTGKLIPKEQAYNRYIFARKYQLTHSDGLTYDFLYNMAKELAEKKSLVLLGAGQSGTEPLVFQESGKPYRAFLEGRINGSSYLLIMHLSNLELKSIL